MIEKSRFKNPMGNFYTKGMFFETTLADKSSVVYTLKNWDHTYDGVVYPSLYRLYMETDDITEYKFAVTHLDSWAHWEALLSCTWFQEYIEAWRKELDLRMKSQALARIRAEAKTSSKEALAANKYLLERGWEPKETSKGRGRPSKDEIKNAAKDIAEQHFRVDKDFDRLIKVQ